MLTFVQSTSSKIFLSIYQLGIVIWVWQVSIAPRGIASCLSNVVSMLDSSHSRFPRPTLDAKRAMFDNLDSGNVQAMLANRLHKCYIAAMKMLPVPGDSDKLEEALFPSQRCSRIWTFDETENGMDCTKELVLFVVDEARSLLAQKYSDRTLFQHLRRSLRIAATDLGVKIFGVMMHACPQIQNFSPANDDEKMVNYLRAQRMLPETDFRDKNSFNLL